MRRPLKHLDQPNDSVLSTVLNCCHVSFSEPLYTAMILKQTNVLEPIRPTVRAVIYRSGDLLVQVKQKRGSAAYLTLPGGKQDPGETAAEALIRECAEEVGTTVTVGPLLHVAEVFKTKADGKRHQLELLFACEVSDNYVPVMGPHPDPSQVGTTWASPASRAAEFRPAYAAALTDTAPVYLGVFDG
ncbi:ADP-ribose pyrophosphatase [Roseibium alexandrii DFL-11]|uniref:ADP-ribose pyrophosphatase n=2 Tax=Roseibium alexandrii TaxID=388408 RepID=A0A5E8GXI8_ROSAD|nr:ADP-ribose pyrophosphatase [Roseibium alexandrii DFL-11]